MQITGESSADHSLAPDVSGELNANVAVSHNPETLVQLCRLWPHIHKSPPPDLPSFCAEILRSFYLRHPALNLYDDRMSEPAEPPHRAQQSEDHRVGIDFDDFSYTSRSLSLVGVLGGILFILLTIAFVTLIKHRKRFREGESDGLNVDRISSHLRQLQQARSSQQLLSILGSLPEMPQSPPPDYDTVEKLREKEEDGDLPSYLEATGTVRLDTVYEETEESRQCSAPDQNRPTRLDESRPTRQSSDGTRPTRQSSDGTRPTRQSSDESRPTRQSSDESRLTVQLDESRSRPTRQCEESSISRQSSDESRLTVQLDETRQSNESTQTRKSDEIRPTTGRTDESRQTRESDEPETYRLNASESNTTTDEYRQDYQPGSSEDYHQSRSTSPGQSDDYHPSRSTSPVHSDDYQSCSDSEDAQLHANSTYHDCETPQQAPPKPSSDS